MKMQAAAVLFILIANAAVLSQTSGQVGRIRKVYTDAAEQARLAEQDDEQGRTGALVVNDLIINSRGHQWRAVGIYQQKFRFFYRGGDSEKHLYPDELVLVKTERTVSNRHYAEEYLFDDRGRLIFYFQRAENDDREPAERRFYFVSGKPVRIIEDRLTRDRPTKKDLDNANNILTQAAQIMICFKGSIKL